MSDTIRISCPHCGVSLTVQSAQIGRTGQCPACKGAISIMAPATENGVESHADMPLPQLPPMVAGSDALGRPAAGVATTLAQQPSHREEFVSDGRRMLDAVSVARDKYALVEPYLMHHEQPVAIAVQRQFPFSIFSDIVLLTTHRLMIFKRFFTKIDMFDVNYVDFDDVRIRQGFFTSSLTVTTGDRRSCSVDRLVTEQALTIYRFCQDIETKARIARRQFALEENRSRTTTMQVNNLVAPPDAFAQPYYQSPPPSRDISAVGDEERNPYRLGQ